MKVFASSQEESMFTQTVEKLGFSITALAKGGGWGINLEAGMDKTTHTESKEIQQSHSTHSYFCSTKFIYIPLASCIFPIDQLQLSNAALQDLKDIEDLLGQSEDPDKLLLLRHRTKAFFQRFGSHADQGPLHLGGIYWWKAISEGFQKEQLAEVKQQAAEALDIYVSESYSGFGVNIGTGNRKIVSDMCQSTKPLIFLLDDKGKITVDSSGPRVRIGIRNRNEAELIGELTTTIKRLLELSNTALSLENCAHIARKQGMLIDEDQRDCKEAKEKAENLMTLLGEMEIPQVKEYLLPLHGKLWQLWCTKDKELYHLREKGNRSIEQHKSETETAKQMIRQKQFRKAFPLNALMRSVLEILQTHSETHTKLYFLQWLNVALDNLNAGHLENLKEKKKALVQNKKQQAPKSSSLKDWQKEIEAISREINDCTLGIEHILREAGQIYEALEEASPMKDTLFLSLPHIAADLMISGVPIELMDGDVSYVPLRWVAAVFDKLSEKLGNKRLFVLSVLGLQSSGKSTLLNALFGLQFTVSAGRCTRGAYMPLLKVEDTFTAELGFDFVLVVDTEGLRAPELSNKSQNHDNELATFVIGLGNLTLINIFGENPSEMQDILQIVVQAFLRMKQVKISPSCLFVHQNVGEVTAKDQNMEGRRRFEEKLDKTAAIAAEEEQCSDVTCFSDVIKFNANTHVYYFAHLWDGNPPMAPPNPRYSHNVQELKSRILVTAQQESRGSIMKISDVKFRVQDLWRALLNENFIFSFRNTQEVMAMSKLETMYNSWTWELRSHVQRLQDQLINQIQNGKIQPLETYSLEAPVAEIYEAIKQNLEKYFNEDPESEVLVQWKGNFNNKLIILKEELILDCQRKANELIHLKTNQEKLENKKSGYEKELLDKSQKLALSLNGTELSEEELHEKFNPLWEKWVCDVSSSLPPAVEPKIEVDSESILFDYFKKEKDMASILENYSGEMFEINYDKHIKMNRKSWSFSTMTIEPLDIYSTRFRMEKSRHLKHIPWRLQLQRYMKPSSKTWENILMKTQIVRCWFSGKKFLKINS
ncbi:hypothetical protein R6Z07M_014137 [Ovis aries]